MHLWTPGMTESTWAAYASQPPWARYRAGRGPGIVPGAGPADWIHAAFPTIAEHAQGAPVGEVVARAAFGVALMAPTLLAPAGARVGAPSCNPDGPPASRSTPPVRQGSAQVRLLRRT